MDNRCCKYLGVVFVFCKLMYDRELHFLRVVCLKNKLHLPFLRVIFRHFSRLAVRSMKRGHAEGCCVITFPIPVSAYRHYRVGNHDLAFFDFDKFFFYQSLLDDVGIGRRAELVFLLVTTLLLIKLLLIIRPHVVLFLCPRQRIHAGRGDGLKCLFLFLF